MICSSVNLLLRICPSPNGNGLYPKAGAFKGSRSARIEMYVKLARDIVLPLKRKMVPATAQPIPQIPIAWPRKKNRSPRAASVMANASANRSEVVALTPSIANLLMAGDLAASKHYD
jgi:hypothetical protein